jgi:hypothetical protein
MALVVYVFAAVLMLEEGLRRTLVDTGSWDNVVVVRRSAGTEVQSGVDREQAGVAESQPEVAIGANGERFVGAGIGERLRFGMRDWTVVGHFDAGRSGFGSEIWGDADQLMQAFRRTVYSSVIALDGIGGTRSTSSRPNRARSAAQIGLPASNNMSITRWLARELSRGNLSAARLCTASPKFSTISR